jgi:WD40 repeat protein
VVTANHDGTVSIWDPRSGASRTLTGHTSAGWWATFDARQDAIVSASKDTTAKVWSLPSGEVRFSLVTHQSDVVRAEFSHDASRIATIDVDGVLVIWDATNGALLTTLTLFSGANSLAFSPDDVSLLVSGTEGVKVIDMTLDRRNLESLRSMQKCRVPFELVDNKMKSSDLGNCN